jgi:hypothetical protein
MTPTAAQGAIFRDLDSELSSAPKVRAGQAVSVAVSPDARTLAILTSGHNRCSVAGAQTVAPKTLVRRFCNGVPVSLRYHQPAEAASSPDRSECISGPHLARIVCSFQAARTTTSWNLSAGKVRGSRRAAPSSSDTRVVWASTIRTLIIHFGPLRADPGRLGGEP